MKQAKILNLTDRSSSFISKKEAKETFLYSFCLLFVVLFLNNGRCNAQTLTDSLKKEINIAKLDSNLRSKKVKVLDPRIISRHCVILPGWGHFELKQYWAPPLIYGGFAFAGYNISVNGQAYRKFVNAYLEASSSNKDQVVDGRTYNVDRLRIIKDGYRRNRDLSYFSIIGIWAFQIIEANVTAHLRTFDTDEDISIKLSPTVIQGPMFGAAQGMKLTFTF